MLHDFWSPDAPFVKVLGTAHITYLAFCFVAVFLFIRSKNVIRKNAQMISKMFLGVIAFQQIFLLYGWYAFCTPNFLSEGLPLHLCRVATLLTIIFLITKSKALMDVICYFSVYALISLFYPLSVYNFGHISGLSYMINHIITVLIPIFAVFAYGWFPSWKGFFRGAVAFTVYLPTALVANALTGGNYFYQELRPFWHDMADWLYALLSYIISVGAFAILTALVLQIRKLVLCRGKFADKLRGDMANFSG